MFSCFDSFDCTPSWKMHFHAISCVLFCSGFFHSVNLLPVRPAFWAAFGGEEKCSLGKSTHVHYVKLHVQEKRTMKMSTHKKSAQWKPGIFETQASIFSTSFLLFRCVKIHFVTDLHFGSGFNSQTQYKFRSLNNGFPKWFWLHETINALYFYKYNP